MKGQITATWLIGTAMTLALGGFGYTIKQVDNLEKADRDTVQRVVKVETQSTQYEKDIAEIKKSLQDNRELTASIAQALGVKIKK